MQKAREAHIVRTIKSAFLRQSTLSRELLCRRGFYTESSFACSALSIRRDTSQNAPGISKIHQDLLLVPLHVIPKNGGVGERLKPAVLKNRTDHSLSC